MYYFSDKSTGVGYMMLVVSFVYCWYYIMVLVWVLVYLVNSFMSQLPWGQCDQTWNTNSCVTDMQARHCVSYNCVSKLLK